MKRTIRIKRNLRVPMGHHSTSTLGTDALNALASVSGIIDVDLITKEYGEIESIPEAEQILELSYVLSDKENVSIKYEHLAKYGVMLSDI